MLCCTSAAKHMRCVCYATWPVETPFWDSCRDGCPTCFRSQKYILISFPWINAIEPASIGIGWCSRSSVGCSSRLLRAPLREVFSANSPCLLLLALSASTTTRVAVLRQNSPSQREGLYANVPLIPLIVPGAVTVVFI